MTENNAKKNNNYNCYFPIFTSIGLIFGMIFNHLVLGIIFGVAIGLGLDNKFKYGKNH